MPDLPDDLRSALQAGLTGVAVDPLRRSVSRLIEAYRSGAIPKSPIVADPADAAAYAAYRMPATFSAVTSCLAGLPSSFEPSSMLDLGGGTGAAAWAAVAAFSSLASVLIADQSSAALSQGATLALGSSSPALRGATWSPWELGAPVPTQADLVTVSYVLGELSSAEQAAVVDAAVRAASGAVLIVEPGTPAGYQRILAARAALIEAGLHIAAPCPHALDCPLSAPDWCHFGVRVNRSALHRKLKEGELSYEDEKFSYVVAMRSPVRASMAAGYSRVLRRPAQRKGLVSLRLCRPDGTAGEQIVTKRLGADVYRAARDVEWGNAFELPTA